jgi:hypothetical protein
MNGGILPFPPFPSVQIGEFGYYALVAQAKKKISQESFYSESCLARSNLIAVERLFIFPLHFFPCNSHSLTLTPPV